MSTLSLLIQQRYLDAIAAGDKTVEGRLDGPRFADLRAGDTLELRAVDAARTLRCAVERVQRYPSFAAMLSAEGLSSALPGVGTVSEGVAIYRAFPGYDQEHLRGVVAMAVRPLH